MKNWAICAVVALATAVLSCGGDKNIDAGLELLEKNETELAMLRFTNAAKKNPESLAAQYYATLSLIMYGDFEKAQEACGVLTALHAAGQKKKYGYGITAGMVDAMELLVAAKNGKDSLYAKPRPDLVTPLEALRDHPHEFVNTGAASILGSWHLKWKFEPSDRVMAPPLVLKDKVVVACGDGALFCAHPEDGTYLWSNDKGAHPFFNNGPFMAAGRLFAVNTDTLYEFDPDNGQSKGMFPDISAKPAIVSADEVYAVYSPSLVKPEDSPYYVVKRIKLGRGRPAWQFRVDGEFCFTTPLLHGNNVLVQATDNFYCLNRQTGKAVWTYKLHTGSYPLSPALADGKVVFGGDKVLYCLDAASGEVTWKTTLKGDIEAAPVVREGMVYVGSNDARVYAVSLADGKVAWKYKTYGGIAVAPAVTADAVYAVSEDGNLYALDRSQGAIRWKYRLGDSAVSAPRVMDGTVFVGSNGTYVFALNEKLPQ